MTFTMLHKITAIHLYVLLLLPRVRLYFFPYVLALQRLYFFPYVLALQNILS